MHFLREALIFLAATVITVPFFAASAGIGARISTAGVVIGPYCLKAVAEVEACSSFRARRGAAAVPHRARARAARLWKLRRSVFGLGSAQVLGTARAARRRRRCVLGLPLARRAGRRLGPVAVVDRDRAAAARRGAARPREHGQAVVRHPAVPGHRGDPDARAAAAARRADARRPRAGRWLIGAARSSACIAGVVLGGPLRWCGRVFRWSPRTHSQEMFTAAALLVVLGTAALMRRSACRWRSARSSPACCSPTREYRHELEADIEPFKGLLLGLFFIAVGMSVDFGCSLARPLLVAGLVLGLVAAQGRWCSSRSAAGRFDERRAGAEPGHLSPGRRVRLRAVRRSPSGCHVMDRGDWRICWCVVVALSMAHDAAAARCVRALVRPRLDAAARSREFDVSPERGRAGDHRRLRPRRPDRRPRCCAPSGIPFTALDVDAEHIDFVRRFGNKVFYGDASRLDLLRAARADKAQRVRARHRRRRGLAATARDGAEAFSAADDRRARAQPQHAYQLLELGVTHLFRETFESSLRADGRRARGAGLHTHDIPGWMIQRFREYDNQLLLDSYSTPATKRS